MMTVLLWIFGVGGLFLTIINYFSYRYVRLKWREVNREWQYIKAQQALTNRQWMQLNRKMYDLSEPIEDGFLNSGSLRR